MLATRAETWKQQWLLEGEQEGRQQGEDAFLLRLLERRFGTLPDWAKDRIATADTATVEEWGLRVLDAGSLDDILAQWSPPACLTCPARTRPNMHVFRYRSAFAKAAAISLAASAGPFRIV